MKKLVISSAVALTLAMSASVAMAGTAAAQMHYGRQLLAASVGDNSSQDAYVHNCSQYKDFVSAYFYVDGSSNTMPIFPVYYPNRSWLTLPGRGYKVHVSITSADGTPLFSGDLIPGTQWSTATIGTCDGSLSATKTPMVTVQ